MDFKIGVQGDYIYGCIFASSKNHGGLVLDSGEIEYPTNSAEILQDGEYIITHDLSSLEYTKIGGVKARIRKDSIFNI